MHAIAPSKNVVGSLCSHAEFAAAVLTKERLQYPSHLYQLFIKQNFQEILKLAFVYVRSALASTS